MNISITLNAPELVTALQQLAEALAGRPEIETKPKAQTTEPAAPAKAETTPKPEKPQATFEDLHAALVELKQRKGTAQVREILSALDCKTVQDIPPEKFADVLRMAAEKMAA